MITKYERLHQAVQLTLVSLATQQIASTEDAIAIECGLVGLLTSVHINVWSMAWMQLL